MAASPLIRSLLLGCTLLLAGAPTLLAQVEIVEHGPFTQMLERMTEINRDPERKLQGFRVQIVATTDRLKLEEVEEKFKEEYPGESVDWIHDAPYYKLRTGAFTDRARATTYLYRIKRRFPSAYLAVTSDLEQAEVIQSR